MRIAESGSHLEAYLEIRQALGLRIDTQRRLLLDFLDFARRQGDEPIRAAWAVEWACAGPAARGPSDQGKALECGPRLPELSACFYARDGGSRYSPAGGRSTA